MIHSMTGFATTHLTWQTDSLHLPITITIKSLNSKFLETTCRIPHILAPLEHTIIQRCKQVLQRGNITVIIHFGSMQGLKKVAIPPLSLVQHYTDALRNLQQQCHLAGEVTLRDLIALPHLFEFEEELIPEQLTTDILQRIDELLRVVIEARTREGTALQDDLTTSMSTIHGCINELEPRAAIISHERREKFLELMSQSLGTASPELKQQHIQALYQQINAIDVHEEIVRLRTHHAEFLKTVTDTNLQKGKRLDFILQEMLREINTLSAKLADAHSIAPILTVKTKLEQAREQVQNIV